MSNNKTVRWVEGRGSHGGTIRAMRVIRQHDWPTREEWAERETAWYGYPEVSVSARVSDYMEPAKIDALLIRLKARWSELGKQGRAIRKQHPQCFRQKGETKGSFFSRWLQLPKDQAIDDFSETRRQVLRAIKILKDGGIPIYAYDGGLLPELEVLNGRRQSAYDAEESRIEAEVAATPIDDAAWAEELARRAEVERVDALPDSEWIIQAGL